MGTTKHVRLILAVLLVLVISAPGLPGGVSWNARQETPAFEVDVLVYGGTSSGVIAAYTAKQYGQSVLLVEPGRHLGGMSSGGLGQTDIGNKYAVTGLGLDFYRRLGRYYGQFEAWQFEPRAAEQVFEQYIDEAGVEVLYSRRLKNVEKDGTRITQVTLEYAGDGGGSPDLVVAAKMFIDATYEGDLMALAGASYFVGREANADYDESYNGVQYPAINHQFPDGSPPVVIMDGTPEMGPPVDPYVVPGDPSSGLLPGITGDTVAPNGTGDRLVQAYNFRMALCQEDQRIPITRPENYDSTRYELLLRDMESNPPESLHKLFIISRMPNGKTDWNNKGAFSTDYIGGSWEYPEADYEERARIWQDHVDYQKGLIYFVGHDPRVPEHIREEMQTWGYCRNEFLDTDGWPHQLYIREARRLVGEYVVTEHDVLGKKVVEDGIGMAAYGIDSHNVQRLAIDGKTLNEGNVQEPVPEPYPISYRAITPKREEVTNLLVSVAVSATHTAYGSIRMEPVFMVLGQSASAAAVMALEADVAVQEIDVSRLQQELRQNPLADGSIPEVLVDDRFEDRIQKAGNWATVDATGQYGPSVLRLEGGEQGSVRFVPEIQTAGNYQVYLYWPREENLATRVAVDIGHKGGVETLTLNMRVPQDEVGLQHGLASWHLLGTFRFEPGGDAYLEIRSDESDGVVFADAALFVPVRDVPE